MNARCLLTGLAVLVIGGCASPARTPDTVLPVAEVAADVRIGAARSFEHCTWYPGAAGFSHAPEAPLKPLGQLVLRVDALYWGDYDMSKSVFQVARRIPFNQIKTIYLAQKAGRNMLVIEMADGALDSFAIEHPPRKKGEGSIPDAAATRETWHVLRTMLGL